MIKVVELFAGVGGFRVGLERASNQFETIWANQWEPSTKSQHAFNCYSRNFSKGKMVNEDIGETWNQVPEHDLLVGGFPCQDYSVARTLSGEQGIQGKKGVLFWQIMKIVSFRKPKYVLLENVDRLLKSPSTQRGRDFSIMLASFRDEGYNVEWRVINAADYGFPQRRRRVFIFASHQSTIAGKVGLESGLDDLNKHKGFFSQQFPIKEETNERHPDISFELPEDLVKISDEFSSKYNNSGVMVNGKVLTQELIPDSISGKTLGDILEEANEIQGLVDEKYYLKNDAKNKKGRTEYEEMVYQKGAKKEKRVSKTGHEYYYTEGGMSFPERLDMPSRTMLTSEGTKNRSTHVVEDLNTKRLRFLTPLECELLNCFPPNWTADIMPERTRYFCMGNALVVGLIEKMGEQILELEKEEKEQKMVTQLDMFM